MGSLPISWQKGTDPDPFVRHARFIGVWKSARMMKGLLAVGMFGYLQLSRETGRLQVAVVGITWQ
jgi:hypothetical protein